MKSFRKAMTGVAVAAALVSSMAAQASTVATADLNIFTLGLVDATTFAPFNSTNGSLHVQSEGRTGNATASFNNINATGVGLSSDSTTTIGAALDIKNRCAGDCGPATLAMYGGGGGFENNTTTHLSTPGTKNFALGDMFISGQALGGAITGLTRADASTSNADNKGNGNATILNNAFIDGTFNVGSSFTGKILVGANAWIQAFVDSMLPTKGSASAGYGWSMTVSSSDDISFADLSFKPDALNKQFSSTKLSQNKQFDNGGTNTPSALNTYLSDTRTFNQGFTYAFTINQSSNVNVSETPEPVSLALVGLGLLAAGVARRAKKSK